MKFEFEGIEADRFAKRLKAREGDLVKAARKQLERLVEEWTNSVRNNFTGWYDGANRTGATPQGRLRNRGKLKSTVGGRVKGNTLDSLRAILRVGSSAAFYAEAQEEGAQIDANRMMTIPVGKALTGAGRLKSAARIVRTASGWGTLGMGRTFIKEDVIFSATTKSGKKRKKPIVLYVLRKSVSVPARLGARHELDRVQPETLNNLSRRFMRILKEPA